MVAPAEAKRERRERGYSPGINESAGTFLLYHAEGIVPSILLRRAFFTNELKEAYFKGASGKSKKQVYVFPREDCLQITLELEALEVSGPGNKVAKAKISGALNNDGWRLTEALFFEKGLPVADYSGEEALMRAESTFKTAPTPSGR